MNSILLHVYKSKSLMALIVINVLFLVGCSASLNSQHLIPDHMAIGHQNPGKVILQVDGGREKHPMGFPEISNETFLAALEAAVENSELFSEVSKDKQGDYKLEAFIFNLLQPMMGGEVTVHLEVAWTLAEAGADTILWQDSIVTSNTTKKDAAFSFLERVGIATEKAARANIKAAFERLSQKAY